MLELTGVDLRRYNALVRKQGRRDDSAEDAEPARRPEDFPGEYAPSNTYKTAAYPSGRDCMTQSGSQYRRRGGVPPDLDSCIRYSVE